MGYLESKKIDPFITEISLTLCHVLVKKGIIKVVM